MLGYDFRVCWLGFKRGSLTLGLEWSVSLVWIFGWRVVRAEFLVWDFVGWDRPGRGRLDMRVFAISCFGLWVGLLRCRDFGFSVL